MFTYSANGQNRHFTKVVCIWTGHTLSGWYGDEKYHSSFADQINAWITFGTGDTDCEVSRWFIPYGFVSAHDPDLTTLDLALNKFHAQYGRWLVVWANPHPDGTGTMQSMMLTNFVATPEQLGFDRFNGNTKTEFKEWAAEIISTVGDLQNNVVFKPYEF